MNDKRVPKFKIGDKIVCIDTSYGKNVTIGKKYEVRYSSYNYINIWDDFGNYREYKTSCFLSLKEYRKQKINNLISIL